MPSYPPLHMEFAPQQQAALQAVTDWLENRTSHQQVFRLFGFAGSGKTTLAKYFAEGIQGRVHFAAYTGKAAYVMRRKGCSGATTIHKLIYLPKTKGRGRLTELREELATAPVHMRPAIERAIQHEEEGLHKPSFSLNTESEILGAALLIVDECSMVGEDIARDLMSFGVPLLVLGDPAQLPPVKQKGYFTGPDVKPDVLLTQVHRQAEGNAVLSLATQIRETRRCPDYGSYGDSRIIRRDEMNQDLALEADQILVGRNATRRAINSRVRELIGFEDDLPVAGDKVVCLKNDHRIGLLNGSLWQVKEIFSADEDRVVMMLTDEEGNDLEVDAHAKVFLGREDEIDYWDRKDAQEFDFGYALTVHKAQGSQWDNILIMDESGISNPPERWLYTAVTRAAESVVVVR